MTQLNINSTIISPNFSQRIVKINQPLIKYVILHFTEIPLIDAIARLCDPEIAVSCHYLIAENGIIYQLVDECKKSWHAGISYWSSDEALNNNSIGIEIDNDGQSPFTTTQINSLIKLCQYLQDKYKILPQHFLGHADIASIRKIDPGIFLPWQHLAAENIGIWPVNIINNIGILYDFGMQGEEIISLQTKLRKFGYKLNISGIYDKNTSDVVRSFKARFHPNEIQAQYTIQQYFNLAQTYSWTKACEYSLNQLLKLIK